MNNDYMPTEELLKASHGSIYKLTMLVAKRALQLADGEKTLVEHTVNDKPLESALKEVREGKIKVSSIESEHQGKEEKK